MGKGEGGGGWSVSICSSNKKVVNYYSSCPTAINHWRREEEEEEEWWWVNTDLIVSSERIRIPCTHTHSCTQLIASPVEFIFNLCAKYPLKKSSEHVYCSLCSV